MKSVRAKLTFVTMLVMGCLLAALGLTVYFGAKSTMLDSVDREMSRRALGMTLQRRPGPDGPPNGGPPGGFARGPGESRPPEPPSLGRQGPAEGPSDLRPVIVRIGEPSTAPSNGPFRSAPYDPGAIARAETGWTGFSNVVRDGNPVRVFTAPRFENRVPVAVVQLGYNLTDIQRSLANLSWVLMVVVIPLGVVLAGVASLFLVASLLRPLREMTGKAGAIGAESIAERLPVVGEDEFASLATTLNAMLARLEFAFAQEQEAKRHLEETVIQQRRFTADASHELKTPLAVVKANAGLALHSKASQDDARDALREIDSAADRMSRLVNDLLTLARVDAGHLAARFEATDLRAILNQAIPQVPSAKGQIKLSMPQKIQVLGSPDDLARVFVNLMDNAVRYGGGEVEINVEAVDNEAHIRIVDHGPGISPEHIAHLFDRFYRIDGSRSSETGGTGLGLAICKGIIEAHQGSVTITSRPGTVTTAFVTLPVAS